MLFPRGIHVLKGYLQRTKWLVDRRRGSSISQEGQYYAVAGSEWRSE